MSGTTLFEVTEEHLNRGLRGVPVGTCSTSQVRPEEGLYYMGLPVSDLALKSPEEVIYLLFYGKFASDQELTRFKQELVKRSSLHSDAKKAIFQLPKKGSAMDHFSIAIMLAGMYEKVENYREDCLNLFAKIPEIAAHVINSYAGWGQTPPTKPELGYMENFTQMLNVPGKDSDALNELFRLFNVLHYDHGGGNLSTFVGKAVSSGLEDLYGSIAAAMNALAGPKHGRANADTLAFNRGLLDEVGDPTPENVEKALRKRIKEKQLIFGFGHAVLRVEDSRAKIFYEVLARRYPDTPLAKLALILREVGPKVLKENPKISNPYPNVDAVSGTVMTEAGFAYPEFSTVLFGLSRTVGISIQIMQEREANIPIYRPKYIFKAPI